MSPASLCVSCAHLSPASLCVSCAHHHLIVFTCAPLTVVYSPALLLSFVGLSCLHVESMSVNISDLLSNLVEPRYLVRILVEPSDLLFLKSLLLIKDIFGSQPNRASEFL